LQDQLEEEKQRVKDLESRVVGSVNDEVAQQLQKSRLEIDALNKVAPPLSIPTKTALIL